MAAARAELDDAQRRFDDYDGNNPNKHRAALRSARLRLDVIVSFRAGSPWRQRIDAATPPNRLTTQRRVAAGRAAMRMGATMMRHGSDQYLTAAMSGMVICMVLLGAILARSVGLAEPGGQVVIVSEQSRATPENDGRVTMNIGLRGSLP
jgi:hypothetical protein